ncbi:hypothetical protein HY030_01320 [Candidatus Gottesmanbacteria bacterium]|nr:hypothetical protein [Candidatus Gottesmanbacteria bacterium]
MIFRYKKFGSDSFPLLSIFLYNSHLKIKIFALIDSGATISIFKEEVAQELRIEIETGKEVFLGGVGGRIKGYIHNLEIEVVEKRFSLPVVFSHEYLVSFNLLGRDTFFENFLIAFNEKDKELKLD